MKDKSHNGDRVSPIKEKMETILKNRLARHIVDVPKSGIREFFELVIGADDVVSLGVGEPDFVTPAHIRSCAEAAIRQGHTSYTSNKGLLSFRESACRYVEKYFGGVKYDPVTECLVTVGVSEGFDLTIRALVNPGDEVIYCAPSYVSYPAEILMAFGVPVPIECREENQFSLNPEDLRKKITERSKMLILNFPCNPTGATLSLSQTREIAEIAIEHDLIVLADEIYSELTYGDRPPSIASIKGMKERTVFLHGMSKAYAMTGFRLGYACGPQDIIDGMTKIHQYSMLCAPIIAQEAAIEALDHGQEAMIEMREAYRRRRDLIVAGLNRIGIPCACPNGAFYVFPRIRETGLTSMEFAKGLLKEQRVAVVPGTAFGTGGEGYIRCCYAVSEEKIAIALEKMEKFVENC